MRNWRSMSWPCCRSSRVQHPAAGDQRRCNQQRVVTARIRSASTTARARSWVVRWSRVSTSTDGSHRVEYLPAPPDSGILSLRIATAANSFKTWTLIVPSSGEQRLDASLPSRRPSTAGTAGRSCRRTTSAALIGLEAIELERGGQPAAGTCAAARGVHGRRAPRVTSNGFPACDLDLDLIALFERQVLRRPRRGAERRGCCPTSRPAWHCST